MPGGVTERAPVGLPDSGVNRVKTGAEGRAVRPTKRAVLAVALLGAGVLAGVGASMPATAATPQTYIVVLDDSVGNPAAAAAAHGVTPTFVYRHALKGYAAPMSSTAAAAIANRPNVRSVTQDGEVTLSATQSPTPSWGLDRIDQRNLPLDNSYVYNQTGAGVRAYIIDSGIRITHNDFGGRAAYGYDFYDNDTIAQDCNGHGTHVAGTVGGSAYGVAKGVTLVAVRVFGCSGPTAWSTIIAAVDWVTGDHDAGEAAVANMSLGGGYIQVVNDAVTNSIADGVTYAVAAGNSPPVDANACNYSPASTPNALTVGATQSNDSRASYSYIGSCLDLFAPGSSITSAWWQTDSQTNTISGTSMATPHVAGAAALVLQAHPTWTPAQVNAAIVDSATTGVVGSPGAGSPNRLLYSLVGVPSISSFTPTSESVGSLVAINGSGFTNVSSVKFNGTAVVEGVVVSPTTLYVRVPNGATTGKVSVTNDLGTGESATNFTVSALPPPSAPSISIFAPMSGPTGTIVQINGSGFMNVSSVKFNGTPAVEGLVISPTTLFVRVPNGATTGKISVTNNLGTGESATNFTIP
jgi:subtilisin family serine protease